MSGGADVDGTFASEASGPAAFEPGVPAGGPPRPNQPPEASLEANPRARARAAPRPPGGRGPGGRIQGLYYALWSLVLWTVFGSYVLAFWLLGLLAYPVVRASRGSGATAGG